MSYIASVLSAFVAAASYATRKGRLEKEAPKMALLRKQGSVIRLRVAPSTPDSVIQVTSSPSVFPKAGTFSHRLIVTFDVG